MNDIDLALYKTRKSPLEACAELGIQYVLNVEITLGQCNSCGIWLKPYQLVKDADGLDICNDCLTYYGE